MNWERISNMIGLGLLGVCFCIAANRVMSRAAEQRDPNLQILKFAHWQLESGVRATFDELAREYERSHPGVRIEQLAIPERIFKNWHRTQLIGGNAPDLIQLGQGTGGLTDELLARYYTPISQFVELPNPYNAGSGELAGLPWRETFLDGLSNTPAYSDSLVEYYGIPASMFTVRVYYNADLFQKIAGASQPPRTYEDFIALCQKTEAYRTAEGESVLPIAGSKYNAPYMIDALFASMTQRLTLKLDTFHIMGLDGNSVALGFLDGQWNWQTPAVEAGLNLMNAVGQLMQPGFLQLGRDDALFYFVQGRALLLASGSWDSSSIEAQAPFKIGVFTMPLPRTDHSQYGQFVLGHPSEAGTGTGLVFGLTAGSKNQDLAIDFLRFISSQPGNTRFAEMSGWLPAVVGVPPNDRIAPFMPITEGYTAGFVPALSGFADTARIVSNHMHRLVGQTGSVAEFIEGVQPDYGEALASDLRRKAKNGLRNAESKDTSLAANWVLGLEDNAEARAKFDQLIEAQNAQEQSAYYLRLKLESKR